jgi:hypothetical protein
MLFALLGKPFTALHLRRFSRGLAAAAAMAMLLPAPLAFTADDATSLASRAEYVLDHWDGNQEALAAAGKSIEEAVKLDPANAHFRGVQAWHLLLANTTEEGIKPSALGQAHGILLRAAIELPPPDARTFAFLAIVKLQLDQNDPKAYWAVKSAERANPNDPYVKLALGRYEAASVQGADKPYIAAAIDAGLASPVELRKAYEAVIPWYLVQGDRKGFDKTVAAQMKLDPSNPYLPGNAALRVIEAFQDFRMGERYAREALAIADYPHARGSLSLALYGQWAEALRDGKDKATAEKLFRKAYANDPGARMVPTCAAAVKRLKFVFTALDERDLRLEDMHNC